MAQACVGCQALAPGASEIAASDDPGLRRQARGRAVENHDRMGNRGSGHTRGSPDRVASPSDRQSTRLPPTLLAAAAVDKYGAATNEGCAVLLPDCVATDWSWIDC